MVQQYLFPITPQQNQSYAININGAQYNVALLFVDAPDAAGDQMVGWELNLYDQDMNTIVLGIALVTGENLLGQYDYKGFNFSLFCYTAGSPSVPPTWATLGGLAQLVAEF